jgi:CheY-like chemotaxis protein
MEKTKKTSRVVIAEDDDDMRDVMCELVSTLGVEVVPASSGGDLVRLLTDDRHVDLIITDVRMPWMTGFQVALAARNSGMRAPIIIVTAFPDDTLRAQIDQLGEAVLLAKPFRPEELLSLVRGRIWQEPATA